MIINYWLPNDLLSPLLRCFHKNRTSFFSGVEDDDLESFFSYGISLWNTEWNLGEILEWKQLTPVQTFQLLSNCYFFWRKKKIYFLWMHGDWPIKRQWGLRSWLDSPVEHFVTLWNDPMWRFIILITINIYIKREITFICGYYREELIWLIKSLVMFAHISF